jgi:hypothetical protein
VSLEDEVRDVSTLLSDLCTTNDQIVTELVQVNVHLHNLTNVLKNHEGALSNIEAEMRYR